MSAKIAQTPRKRKPTSPEHREKLRQSQLAYVANDPRWAEHRQRLAHAQRKPEQRATLSERQRAYMENDPRWPEHQIRFREAAAHVYRPRQVPDAAVEAFSRRLTLLPEEVDIILKERAKGRTWEYLAEELCLSRCVLRREVRGQGISTEPIRSERRAKRTKGFWRSFDPVS